MTLPAERTRAVIQTRAFLRRLSSSLQPDGFKRISKEVRSEAMRLLRHYPSIEDMLEPAESFDQNLAQSLIDAD